jgi:hypothetical protein
MTSTRRAEANLRNSARSTGPRLLCGKSRARLNAVTHGLTAETLILPGEDPREFQRRLDGWTAALAPANPFEHDLVRQVATLSWRLDRADRVQDALIADSLGTVPAEEDKRRREEVEDLGRRLLPPPRVPNFVRRFGVWADLDRLAHRGPDDPDDPARLLLRLEATADGCRWLLDRWAELRQVVDAGIPWPDEQMVHAIRLLGKRPHDAVDDLEVLTIFVACFALEPSRPDPFAELWKTTTDREAIYYRQRLLGRRLREAKPRSKEHAREVLLDVVDAAVSRLEEQEIQNRRREAELAALRPEMLLFDASPEGEWVRREQGKATRSILRITERFRKARRRGETLSPDPPKPPRLDPAPIQPIETRPLDGPQERMEAPYQRPGRMGAPIPVVIFDHPRDRMPREYIGGRAEGRYKEVPNLRRRPRKCSPERAEKIAIRAIQWLKDLGLVLLIAAAVWTSAGAPKSGRPEDSARRAQPVILDAPDHPLPGHPGPEWGSTPLNRASDPRNEQNEAKTGEIARILPAARPQILRLSDRSRGPPGARGDPSLPARHGSQPPDRRAVAVPRALCGDGPSGRGGRADVTTADFLPDRIEDLATSGCERG